MGRDAGGLRWALDGYSVHAGTGLELAMVESAKWCDPCDGEGRIGPYSDFDGRRKCQECAGIGQIETVRWAPVRLEFAHYPRPRAVVHFSAAGGIALHVTAERDMRFRWPEGAHRRTVHDWRPEPASDEPAALYSHGATTVDVVFPDRPRAPPDPAEVLVRRNGVELEGIDRLAVLENTARVSARLLLVAGVL